MTWGGAQWVMLCILVFRQALPPMLRIAGIGRGQKFAGWYIAKTVDTIGLVGLLWWGGFWS